MKIKMPTSRSSFSLALFIVTWVYLWIRAAYVPLVHDESATFFIYIQSGNFLPLHSYADANNHLLNSALSYLSFYCFGSSSLAIRLPNLLCWPLYFFSILFISQRLHHKSIRWLFFLSLIFAHNFIEFFGLCRGYGMSMGLLMTSVYFLLLSLEKKMNTYRILCVIFLMLALSANLTLINTVLIFIVVLVTGILLEKKTWKVRCANAVLVIVIALLPMYYLLKWLFFLKKYGLLYYHSVDGFFHATPGTLANMLTGIDSMVPAWIFSILIILVIILFIRSISKTALLNLENWIIFSVLLLGNIFAIIIANWMLGINYPEDRTAMFLFPLLCLSLAFLLDKSEYRFTRLIRYPVALLFLFFPASFIFSLNVSHSSLWYQEGIPQRFYKTIEKDSQDKNIVPSIGGYMLRRFCWGYMNYNNGGLLPMIKTSSYPEMMEDYQVVHMNKEIPWLYLYKQLDYNLPSGLYLLERKNRLLRKEIFSSLQNQQEIQTEAEYYSLFNKDIDSLHTSALFVEVSFDFLTDEYPIPFAVIGNVNDNKGNTVASESMELNWYRYKWQAGNSGFHQGFLLTQLPGDSKHLNVYLVNSLKKRFSVKNYKVIVYNVLDSIHRNR